MAGFSQSGIDTATFALAFNERTRLENGDAIYDGYLPAGHSGSLTPVQPGQRAPEVRDDEDDRCRRPGDRSRDAERRRRGRAPISPTITYTSVGSEACASRQRRAQKPVPALRGRGAPHRARFRGATVVDRASRPRRSCGPHSCGCSSGPRKVSSRPRPPSWTSSRSAWSRKRRSTRRQRQGRRAVPVPRRAAGPLRGPCDIRRAVSSPGGTALAVDVLEDLYGDPATYEQRFAEGLDETISAGFLLPWDRAGILTAARAQARAGSPLGDDEPGSAVAQA